MAAADTPVPGTIAPPVDETGAVVRYWICYPNNTIDIELKSILPRYPWKRL